MISTISVHELQQQMPLKTIMSNLEELKQYKAVYCIYQSGGRSQMAAMQIAPQLPGVQVVNVEGGTMAWLEAGFPKA